MTNKPQEHGSILDVIKEQTTNIELFANRRSFDVNLSDNLKAFASKERSIRESTIGIRNVEGLDQDLIAKLIEENWVVKTTNKPPTYWKDKANTYVQFTNKEDKFRFIEDTKSFSKFPALTRLNGLISKQNRLGEHFTRKEVKFEILNVPEGVNLEKVSKLLGDLSIETNASITGFKEGKLYGPSGRKMKSIMFKADAAGFSLVFDKLNGVIPYTSTTDNKRLKLWPRVNSRPWSCRECYFIGNDHKCNGKACAQCGLTDHITKECKQKTRNCTNCKKYGHRAKDAHCPIYMREVLKEIKRMDIPLEYLEDEVKRFDLIKSLIFK